MSKKKHFPLFLFILAFVLPFFLRMAYLRVPLERDEGAYAYGAWRILEGEVLYRDMVDFTPPGIFYIYAGAIKICGSAIEDIRLFSFLYMEITLIFMFLLARKIFTARRAWISTAVLGFISAEPIILGFTSNKETFMLLPIIAGAFFMLKGFEEHKKYLFFISGIIVGAGFFIKQVMAYYIAGMIFFAGVYAWKKCSRDITSVLLLTGGILFSAALVSLYFIYKGAFRDFYYWVWKYPFEFADAPVDKKEMLWYLGQQITGMLRNDLIFWITGMYAVWELLRKNSWQGWFLVSMGISLMLAVQAGFRFRPHYFILLTPMVALASGTGISQLFDFIHERWRRTTRTVLYAAVFCIIAGVPLSANWQFFFTFSPDEISRRIYGANPFVEAPRIADYIKQATRENDPIFIVGSEPEIYFYAQRKNPTKHLFLYPLTAQYGKSSEFQKDTISSINDARPYYIIWMDIQTSLYASEPADDRYVFEELEKLIESAYVFDGYVLIGRDNSIYALGADSVDPVHRNERIPIYLYKRRS